MPGAARGKHRTARQDEQGLARAQGRQAGRRAGWQAGRLARENPVPAAGGVAGARQSRSRKAGTRRCACVFGRWKGARPRTLRNSEAGIASLRLAITPITLAECATTRQQTQGSPVPCVSCTLAGPANSTHAAAAGCRTTASTAGKLESSAVRARVTGAIPRRSRSLEAARRLT